MLWNRSNPGGWLDSGHTNAWMREEEINTCKSHIAPVKVDWLVHNDFLFKGKKEQKTYQKGLTDYQSKRDKLTISKMEPIEYQGKMG